MPLKNIPNIPSEQHHNSIDLPRLLELQQSAWFALYHMSALQVTTFQGYPLTAHTHSLMSRVDMRFWSL